jgi:polyisoprenoid-binding protein YceI
MKQGKGFIYRLLAILILVGTALHFVATQSWQIGEGYTISFSSNDASGVFNDLKGSIFFDEQNLSACRFDVTIVAGSINTGNGLQNRTAKSNEWFDVLKYPVIRYVSQNITRSGRAYQVNGTLDMHGVKKTVIIPFSFQRGSKGAVFAGTFTINRSDFGIGKPGGDVAALIKVDVRVPVVTK